MRRRNPSVLFSVICVMLLTILMCFSGCNEKSSDPISRQPEDVTFGDGNQSFVIQVSFSSEHSEELTINTSMNTVGEALLDQNLITVEDGENGRYITSVFGIAAAPEDDEEQAGWVFYIDNVKADTNIMDTEISQDVTYALRTE